MTKEPKATERAEYLALIQDLAMALREAILYSHNEDVPEKKVEIVWREKYNEADAFLMLANENNP